MSEQNTHEVAIIGSGPAGLTAAIYAARANLNPLVFAGYEWGGQLMTTTEVENFPGFPEGIQGPALMQLLLKQAERFGAKIVFRDIEKIVIDGKGFELLETNNSHKVRAVIAATGASPRKLGIKGEQEYWAKGVSSCATCDGAFFRDRVVVVVGGGDSAMEESLFLTRFATKVILIHRRDEYRASKIMQERVIENPKIERIMNTEITEVVGDGELVSGIKIKDLVSGAESELKIDGFFLAIGHDPAIKVFKDHLTLDDLGYLKTENHSMSNIPGIFIAGDVHDHRYRQAITAAGEGCKAAIDVERWLEEQGS